MTSNLSALCDVFAFRSGGPRVSLNIRTHAFEQCNSHATTVLILTPADARALADMLARAIAEAETWPEAAPVDVDAAVASVTQDGAIMSRKAMAKHEATCKCNPARKACATCVHQGRDDGYRFWCNLELLSPDGPRMVVSCPSWKDVLEASR